MAYFFERGKSLAGPLGLRKNLPIFLLRNRKNPPIVSSRRTTPDGAEPAPAARPERNSQPRHLADSVGDRDRGGGETKRFEAWKSGGNPPKATAGSPTVRPHGNGRRAPPLFRASKGRTDETMPTATREGAK